MSVIIVIDPGHGSDEYHGGESYPYVEKDIDLSVATYMKQQLEKYDDVTVLLTRSEDVNVELKARCDFAKASNADYFVSIHFNMSSEHDLYGTEVWLSSKKDMYNSLYPFAKLVNESISSKGLYSRGIKTRLSSKGEDYYAVIRHNTDYGIPACIIEHCYLDNANDYAMLGTPGTASYEDTLRDFGVRDAEAFAKFAHLKSTALGVDYSGYAYELSSRTESIIMPDTTAPEICELVCEEIDRENKTAFFRITASDSDGMLNYYRYSVDGGDSFTDAVIWPKGAESVLIDLHFDNEDLSVVCEVLNGYDISKISNKVDLAEVLSKEALVDEEDAKAEEKEEDNIANETEVSNEEQTDAYISDTEASVANKENADTNSTKEFIDITIKPEELEGVVTKDAPLSGAIMTDSFYLISFGVISLLFVIFIVTFIITFSKGKKRRIRRVEDKRIEEDDEI